MALLELELSFVKYTSFCSFSHASHPLEMVPKPPMQDKRHLATYAEKRLNRSCMPSTVVVEGIDMIGRLKVQRGGGKLSGKSEPRQLKASEE